jgi:hypothetical protein
MPAQHDSVNDALVAVECLRHYLDQDGKVDPVERTARRKSTADGGGGGCQLFVHRIPPACQATHVEQMFLEHTSIQPAKVDPIEFASGATGKTMVHFRSTCHANLAFDTLKGKPDTDPTMRLQKKVFLKTGGYIRVRKMVAEDKDRTCPASS